MLALSRVWSRGAAVALSSPSSRSLVSLRLSLILFVFAFFLSPPMSCPPRRVRGFTSMVAFRGGGRGGMNDITLLVWCVPGGGSVCRVADGGLSLREEGPRVYAAAHESLRRDVPGLARHDRQSGE